MICLKGKDSKETKPEQTKTALVQVKKNDRTRSFLQAPVIVSAVAALIVGFLSTPYLSGESPGISSAALVAAAVSFMTPIKTLAVGEAVPPEIEFVGEDDAGDDAAAGGEMVTIPYIEETKVSADKPQALAGEDTPISAVNPTPVKPDNAGTIVKKLYEAGTTPVFLNINEGFLKNCTDRSAKEVLNITAQKPKFKIKADGSPEVLIMHTHATESYQLEAEDWYIKGQSGRTTDNTKNTVRVGDEIEKQLIEAGIGVVHDKTQHDYPSYNGAYERSAATVKRILKENPSIKVVLDVHRDAIQPDNNTIIAPTVEINGRSCAQVMIISGCENGKLGLPKWAENLKFSSALQRSMAEDYSGLARPILFDYRKYNQDLTTGSILLEMGGHANTLDEAIYCGELVGKSLVKTLLELK